MTWINMLQQAINYMEEHLLEDLNYEDVASMVYMSSYEFHRTFSIMSGMTANTYIRNRRLSLAGKELMETNEKVIDVALKYGYDTPESFTKAFTRFHGVSPKCAKKPGTKLHLFNPLAIKVTMEGGNIMDYRIEERKGQKFLAITKEFPNEDINSDKNEVPKFWDKCLEKNWIEELAILRPEGKRDVYGLCSATTKGQPTFNYGIGVVLDDETTVPNDKEIKDKGMVTWETSNQQYAVFECMGKDSSSINDVWNKFYKEFLPQMGYKASYSTDFEIYKENGKEGMFCELWIPIEKD